MAWWLGLLLWAGTTAISVLFRPRPPRPVVTDAKPEKFQGITAEEGRPIPVVWGTREVRSSNLGWYGDLSQTAIVQSGATVGYKYYLGAMYAICVGPLTALVEARWNEKPVGAALDSANNGMRIAKDGVTFFTAAIPASNYSPSGIAQAAQAAMRAADPGDWKVDAPMEIVSGFNDELVVSIPSIGWNNKKAYIGGGSYSTGASLALAVADALNAIAPNAVNFVCTYSLVTSKFTITSNASNLILENASAGGVTYARTALVGLGFHLAGSGYSGSSGYTGDSAVTRSFLMFGYPGSVAKLKLTDAAFTAAAVLGLSTAADVVIGLKKADNAFVSISATYTDQGDFIQLDVNDASFFATEGGVTGRMDIYKGLSTQAACDYLTTKWLTQASGFRYTVYAAQRGMYIGNTNYPKPVSFVVKRVPNQLGLSGGKHDIAGDANPACMIYEILTDEIWGLAVPGAQIDTASFTVAGNTLYDESLGMSYIVDASTSASEVVQEILRHIDGIVYVDQVTGLIAMRLARNDYVVASLPLVNKDNADYCKMSRSSWDETRNVVRLRYISRALNYTERVEQIQNLASIQARGEMAVEELVYAGISNAATAKLVAKKALKAMSYPLAQFEIQANRESWALRPGSVFRLTWDAYGITDLPCRVTNVDVGSLDDGKVKIDAIEDIVGPAWSSWAAPTPPADDPAEVL